MEIKFRHEGKLVIQDDKRKFAFMDLTRFGYHIMGENKHHWILYEYRVLCRDNIELTLITSYHAENGAMAEMFFGYHMNQIVKRKLTFDKDGILNEDKILFGNPRYLSGSDNYYAKIPENIGLEEYLSDEDRYYESYDKKAIFRNRILGDDIIEDYLYYNNRYGNLLNYYCDHFNIVNDIVARFEDEWFINDLEREIKKKNGKVKALKKEDIIEI